MLSLVKDVTLKMWPLLGVDESFSRCAQPIVMCVFIFYFLYFLSTCVYVLVRVCVFWCMSAQCPVSSCRCFFLLSFNCPGSLSLGLPQGLGTQLHTHSLQLNMRAFIAWCMCICVCRDAVVNEEVGELWPQVCHWQRIIHTHSKDKLCFQTYSFTFL